MSSFAVRGSAAANCIIAAYSEWVLRNRCAASRASMRITPTIGEITNRTTQDKVGFS